jgi:PKD repeat protein
VGVTFQPPTSLEQNWTVTLACLPAQRAECYSDLHTWQVDLLPPLGKLLLPGIYEHAGNVPDSTHGAIRVGQACGAFTTCTTTDSWFEVKQVQYSGGQLQSLWARFARRCAPTPWGTYDLSGEIRYHVALPAFTDPPTRVQAHAGAQLRAEILVGGASPGTPTVTSPDLPVGAALTPVSNGRTFLEWTPALEDAGSYEIRLIASTAGAEPDTSVMTVCVDIPGAVSATMDANRTEVITSNRGDASYAASFDQYGAYHPAGSGIPVANAAGFLLAARVDGEVRIAQGGCDFVPGPMSGGSAAPFEPRFKNYTIRRGEPFGYDWDHWPRDLGAPVDEAGNPAVLGDATIWSLYNDARLPGPDEPVRWTQPLGIEVHQTTWAEASGTPLGDVVFQRYRVLNRGAHTLEDAYVAWEVNATTADYYGGHVAIYSRNASGCDTTLSLGYAYSGDYEGRPNAVGIAVVQGPGLTAMGVTDTLGLTAYQDRTFQTALAAHFQMRGYRSDGLPRHEYDDPSRPETPYAYSGDPVTGSGWLYPTHPYTIARFLASSGPFRLPPGEEQEVVVAIVAASSGSPLDAVTLLRASAKAAKTALSRYATPPRNEPPLAEAGGPYSGRTGVPVAFDGTVSRDPEGAPLAFDWSFGDGANAKGAQPLHTYAQDGSYPVVLMVSDGHLEATDSTVAEIATIDTASVALLPGDSVIRLQSSRPLVWISLEPQGDAFQAADISLETVALYRPERPDLAIRPEVAKAEAQDRDRDGVEEIALPFRKTDLRTLFADLPAGPNEVPVAVRGELSGGGSFLAVSHLHVEVSGKRLTANVSPNPARGPATLTFRTSRAGPVRVSVYDVSGRLVRVLLDEAMVPTGYYDLPLAGGARALPSGIYFYRVEALEGTTSCRVLVLK